jgi:hypothetical protein
VTYDIAFCQAKRRYISGGEKIRISEETGEVVNGAYSVEWTVKWPFDNRHSFTNYFI